MLDQNTDRMWYVIGAVLIGAAIIFGMSTLMPEAFASVEDNAVSIMTDVHLMMNDPDVKFSKANFSFDKEPTVFGFTIGGSGSIVEQNISVEPNTRYRLVYDTEGHYANMVVLTQSGESTRTTHNGLYSDPVRIKQHYAGPNYRDKVMLENDDGSLREQNLTLAVQTDSTKSFDFKTDDKTTHISLTTGNYSPYKTLFTHTSFSYKNIKLIKVPIN